MRRTETFKVGKVTDTESRSEVDKVIIITFCCHDGTQESNVALRGTTDILPAVIVHDLFLQAGQENISTTFLFPSRFVYLIPTKNFG